MGQIKDTLPGISAVLEMKWRHKVCVAGGWWGGGADQKWLERQSHSCPLQIGLWELGRGSRVERQTQTAAVEDVKSLARVDRELGVVTQRPVSTPPSRPSDRLRRENFPCCIPVLLSGLRGNARNNAGGWLQLPACPARISLKGIHFLKDSRASENVKSREPGSRVDLRLLHGPSYSPRSEAQVNPTHGGPQGAEPNCRSMWVLPTLHKEVPATGATPAQGFPRTFDKSPPTQLHHWARNLHYSFQHHFSWKPWLLHSPEIIHQTFSLWKSYCENSHNQISHIRIPADNYRTTESRGGKSGSNTGIFYFCLLTFYRENFQTHTKSERMT